MTIQRIKLRRGTAAAWTSANPTLAAGEPGYETDTGKHKIGNGATAWASLAYVVPTAAALAADSAFTSQFAPKANPTFTGNVVVPTANAAGEAAQVTAIDPTTGRLAIGGIEMGDTGWRDIKSTLTNGWVAGAFAIRRVGCTIWVRMQSVSAAAATSNSIILLPVGFRTSGVWVVNHLPPSASNATLIPSYWKNGNELTLPSYTSATKLSDGILYEKPMHTTLDAWPS